MRAKSLGISHLQPLVLLFQVLSSQRAHLPLCIPWQMCHRGVPSVRALQQSHCSQRLLWSHVCKDPRNKH